MHQRVTIFCVVTSRGWTFLPTTLHPLPSGGSRSTVWSVFFSRLSVFSFSVWSAGLARYCTQPASRTPLNAKEIRRKRTRQQGSVTTSRLLTKERTLVVDFGPTETGVHIILSLVYFPVRIVLFSWKLKRTHNTAAATRPPIRLSLPLMETPKHDKTHVKRCRSEIHCTPRTARTPP